MNECKKVTAKNLSIGQRVEGWELGSRRHSGWATVTNVNPAQVSVKVFDRVDEVVDVESLFLVKLTEQEFQDKYKALATEIFENIQKSLSPDEIGEHDMYNAWIETDLYRMAAQCKEDKLRIIGHCKSIRPKTSFFGTLLDIGICIEYSDGTKCWCHFSSDGLKLLLHRHEKSLLQEFSNKN